MLQEISTMIEPMRFAKIEAYKIFDAVEFARPVTMELQTQLKWPC